MTRRKDGQETRDRILEAACQLFGDKGYRAATHAEICRRADVNIAAINYHFGSKAELYRAAWTFIVDEIERSDGPAINLPDTPEDRLRAHIRKLLLRRSNELRFGQFHRIRLREILSPTGALDEIMSERVHRNRSVMHDLLRELLGPDAAKRDLELCEMSVISQCIMARPLRPRGVHHAGWQFTERDLSRLEEHVFQFSMAGIEAVRRELSSRRRVAHA